MSQKINGEVFFNKLYKDEEFCMQLGKVMLSASKLETQLIKLIENNKSDIKGKYYTYTMGRLIIEIKKAKLLPKNTIEALISLSIQRNYLTHSIFIILSDIVEDSKLIENINADNYIKKNIFEQVSEEKEEFLDSDTQVYIERASKLSNELNSIADIVSNINKKN